MIWVIFGLTGLVSDQESWNPTLRRIRSILCWWEIEPESPKIASFNRWIPPRIVSTETNGSGAQSGLVPPTVRADVGIFGTPLNCGFPLLKITAWRANLMGPVRYSLMRPAR